MTLLKWILPRGFSGLSLRKIKKNMKEFLVEERNIGLFSIAVQPLGVTESIFPRSAPHVPRSESGIKKGTTPERSLSRFRRSVGPPAGMQIVMGSEHPPPPSSPKFVHSHSKTGNGRVFPLA